ncbi:MAG: ferrous iron transport protein A [Terriglobales bacterium]
MNFNLDDADPKAPSASLADLREGQTAVLSSLSLPQRTSEHLMWLGFVPGAEVTAGQSGPGGDPRIYRVSGTAFALRRETARRMLVTPKPPRRGAHA